jgi:hypothetical protein
MDFSLVWRTPAAIARAGIRLWEANSSDVCPNPGSAITSGSRCRPSSPGGTTSNARRPPGNLRTDVPGVGSLQPG